MRSRPSRTRSCGGSRPRSPARSSRRIRTTPGAGSGRPGLRRRPRRPRAARRSPLVDTGDPEPLDDAEPLEDAARRGAGGRRNGDGVARRDVGALERRPPLPPSTRGNLLANPGAEQGTAATNDTASPAPPRWTRTGAFTSVRYGTVSGPFAFPPLDVAAALRAATPSSPAAPAPRRASPKSSTSPAGRPRSTRAPAPACACRRCSADSAAARTARRCRRSSAPDGRAARRFALDAVTAAERANATMLTARRGRAPVPRLTRTIAVMVRAGAPGGAYNDAYADDIALVPRIPRAPRPAPSRGQGAGRSPACRCSRGGSGSTGTAARGCASDARAPRSAMRRRGDARAAALHRARHVRIALSRGVRRVRFRSRGGRGGRSRGRRTAGHVYAASRDGQGVTRTSVTPVRIVRR